ncbi:MAG: MBL fold metallo-hydrolase [Myxococcota bacterium]
MATKITFHGAAGTVTGSCYRIEHSRGQFLVDCGLFQGNKSVRELNWRPFPFDAGKLDYLIVTHAHIDHAGLVPKLVRHGFDQPIYATRPTKDLLAFLLPDSASIQESDAARANKRRAREGKPLIEPAYTSEHAEQALNRTDAQAYETWFSPGPGVRARFWNAGHILGSASVEVEIENGKSGDRPLRLLFSGDLGPDEKAFYADPEAPQGFDYILCESTYGGRQREEATLRQRRKTLRKEIRDAIARGGNLVIPSFAVERSQELLHDIGVLLSRREIPQVTVFLDSPLARKVTGVFVRYASTLEEIEVDEKEIFRHPNFEIVQSVDGSKAIKDHDGPAIILSASGMCDAGRIKHHLRNNLWRKDSTVLFVGYQAPGTLGHILQGGAKSVRIHGKEVDVNARIRRIGNYSAHADQDELVAWVQERLPVHGGVFLTHGEQEQRKLLKKALVASGVAAKRVLLPDLDETFTLTPSSATGKPAKKRRIDPAELERDWYNDYAALILALGKRLEGLKEPGERKKLIRKLQRALG